MRHDRSDVSEDFFVRRDYDQDGFTPNDSTGCPMGKGSLNSIIWFTLTLWVFIRYLDDHHLKVIRRVVPLNN